MQQQDTSAAANGAATSTSGVVGHNNNTISHCRRQFSLWRFRFQMPRGSIMDICLDGLQTLMEGAVYILGPFLIILALGIVSMLSYTFFTIILPMIMEKHNEAVSMQYTMVIFHSSFVIFFLVNILFNYAMCVLTKNDGPLYDKVVRELASVTAVMFPETPAQLLEYRRDFEDRMVIRMRRRRAREEEEIINGQLASSAEQGVVDGNDDNKNNSDNNGNDTSSSTAPASQAVTHRRGNTTSSSSNINNNATNTASSTPSTVVRRWMLMGPYEWGFCANSRQPKPPRSHYDHVTKKLVLNLDHYCPWVFNAVGYFNYRYFVNFLIFVFLGMCYGAIITLEPFLWLQDAEYTRLRTRERQAGHHLTKPHPMLPRREEKMLVSLSFMLCLAVGVAVLLLGGFHIYLTLTAQTTIEFHGNWAKRKRLGAKFRNPYDQGWRRNWKQVYGDLPWYIAILPSKREPDYLPVPIPGKNTRRKDVGMVDDNEERVAFLDV